jgi:hypothetical protein
VSASVDVGPVRLVVSVDPVFSMGSISSSVSSDPDDTRGSISHVTGMVGTSEVVSSGDHMPSDRIVSSVDHVSTTSSRERSCVSSETIVISSSRAITSHMSKLLKRNTGNKEIETPRRIQARREDIFIV